MIPYSRQFIDEDDIDAVVGVLRSDWITQGPKIQEFEKKLASCCGSNYAVAVSSGTAGLHIACLAAGIKPGDEVITSPITFVASANCVLYCGGKPVFADVQEDTVNIDPEKIKKQVSERTKAVIPVHFAGHPCDLEEVSAIAREHDLILIEDACHALGAEYKGQKIGSCKHSDMTVFSFHPVKSITTGEGGAILTNRQDLYEKLLMLRSHGITKEPNKFLNKDKVFFSNPESLILNPNSWYYEMQELGFNYRLTDIQCVLGMAQLKKLNKFIERRREITEIYKNNFKGNEFFNLPKERDHVKSSWHLYPIKLKNDYKKERRRVFDKLREKGLGVHVHYIPVYRQPYYQRLGYNTTICPKAENFYQREISIPLYYSMSAGEIDYVVDTILKTFKEIQASE
ncbi:MAG TPA: UDP-4-amino-4,6-dideoxy-N-acetyl-beta-L-altrosamine transaminase [Actinobacteria bacterium]|nr:UDP-4-amino-4,6-dideoxy-N-acetyl-beta-L-altrosamine transaminase [Actinomycetota bacterium]